VLRIAKSFHFASAHRLYREDWDERKNIDMFGKCYRLHGHNYKLTVEVGGDVDPDTAMVLNYYELTAVIDRIIVQKWDHQYVNDIPDFQDYKLLTTAENMIMVAKRLIDPQFHGTPYYLTELTLQESERTYARWIR
jgi:6-pyruvoyltetrahydropterin/6-carboxytetrahydropterin synthase